MTKDALLWCHTGDADNEAIVDSMACDAADAGNEYDDGDVDGRDEDKDEDEDEDDDDNDDSLSETQTSSCMHIWWAMQAHLQQANTSAAPAFRIPDCWLTYAWVNTHIWYVYNTDIAQHKQADATKNPKNHSKNEQLKNNIAHQ